MTAIIFFLIFLLWLFLYTISCILTEIYIHNEKMLCIANLICFVFTLCVSTDIILWGVGFYE